MARLSRRAPLTVTGDLRADALVYTRQLLADLRADHNLLLAKTLGAAMRTGGLGFEELRPFVESRLHQIQAMLAASGTTELDFQDVLELILAPAYTHALLDRPLPSDTDAESLVDNLIAVLTHRRSRTPAQNSDSDT
ncbi:TetR/AcrR family transcriptional regulator C-terminal ligand-binding domain-containing protein [Streptomyces sp. NPDC048663]|uniref:TetR/AcrR family transcriptional regulator C-terminal ligand-binding domain-containing protein n=1 Tax=Streptomyces sp. NPDC048663 TaxID=3155638 RepID=UPI00341C4F56